MTTEIELATVDTRFEPCRVQHPAAEARLLSAIAQRGLEEPLEGVEVAGRSVLLHGFKRYRCALKLSLQRAPYRSLGTEVAAGLLHVLRAANHPALSLLEQAAFLDELHRGQALRVADLAAELSRSPAWVSLRLGLMAELSAPVRERLFTGAFPASAYLYTVRPFRRLKGVTPEQMEQFILAVSGHHLSVREIEHLAHGFFRGPESFRQEILHGNLALPLQQWQAAAQDPEECNAAERGLLHDLDLTQKYMQRVMGQSLNPQLQSRAFHAQSHVLTGGLLSRAPAFFQTVRQLHDRNGQA
jgi:hypothetical protein